MERENEHGEARIREALSTLAQEEGERRSLFLPLVSCALALLLAFFSFLLYRPEGYGALYRSASLIGEFLTEDGAVSVFLGLEEEKEAEERRERLAEKARAYMEEREG